MAEQKTTRRDAANAEKQRRYLCENLSFAGKEAYKRLRTNIQFCFTEEAEKHTVGVTSAQPSDGKSTTAVNLAYTSAQLNKRVLLIDADMRKPSLDAKLGVELTPGLSNLLTEVNNVVATVKKYVPQDESLGFDVLTAGDVPPNPSELLHSERMRRLMERLATVYDLIVVDLPPVGAVADAQVVSGLVDGMLIVVREGHCSKFVMDDCISQLKLTGTKIFGFVVNGAVEGSSKSYSYGKYGKYGSYGNYGGYYK